MKKINLTQELLDLEGQPLKDSRDRVWTLGLALSFILIHAQLGGAKRCYKLAKQMAKAEEVELDKSDFTLCQQAVEATTAFNNNLIKGQVETMLDEVLDVSKE